MSSRAARVVAASVLALHVPAGVVALRMLPRGFGPGNIHLWSNTVIPLVCSLAVTVALIAYLARWSTRGLSLVAAAAGGWTAAVSTGLVLYPSSMSIGRGAVPALIAIALLVLARWASERRGLTLTAVVVGAGLGVIVIVAQRAPFPSTRPAGGTLAEVQAEPSDVAPFNGDMTVACGTHTLSVNPLLTFISRSPDRTWTILTPQPFQQRTVAKQAKTPTGFRVAYVDDGNTTLVAVKGEHALEIEAVTALRAPVYSHLNSFTSLRIPFAATISFSPTGANRFPIEPADYPSGRPVQLAYVDPARAFRVVRASDAEKGPYTELAVGELPREAAVTLEIHARDDDANGCRLVFLDWAAQVSTEPSPSAGWGVAQGSIQFFSQLGEGLVFVTLADTGPGRGFDSVGHAAGTYRNRLRVEPLR